MNTLTNGKANRQRKNAKKYEVTKIKVEKKKKDKAVKKEKVKKEWIKKDKKKNGKLVKGGASHKEHLAEVAAKASEALDAQPVPTEGRVLMTAEDIYPPEA